MRKSPRARPHDHLVTRFVEELRTEDPELAERVEGLDPLACHQLGDILARFDHGSRGDIEPGPRRAAARVLRRLRDIDHDSLVLVNRVLDYLDLVPGARRNERQAELAVQVLEIFALAEADGGVLGPRELEMLHAVLRHFDLDDSQTLEESEVRWLRYQLSDAPAFMARQRQENPLLRRMLGDS